MRILLINKFHYLKGGAERAYFDTARILAEKGHEVAFFSMQHPDNVETPWSRFFVSEVNYHEQRAGIFRKIGVATRIIWNREAARRLKALIDEFKPDIAHLHNTYHQLSPSIIWTLKKQRVPMIMTLHDYKAVSPNYNLFVRGKIWEQTSGWAAFRDRAVQNSSVKSAVCAVEKIVHTFIKSYEQIDAFIAPSRFLIEKMKTLGFTPSIEHVPQPLSPFPPVPPQDVGDYLLFIGRLSEEKGVMTLVDAMRALPTERLKIVGTGPAEAELQEKSKGLGTIEFCGYQSGSEWEKLLQSAKALVVPSVWYENMPYVVIEALSRGKPVIASNLGGMVERVHEGENGFLFEAGSAGALAEAVHKLDRADQKKLGQAAWESVADLTPDTHYERLMALYSRVTGKASVSS